MTEVKITKITGLKRKSEVLEREESEYETPMKKRKLDHVPHYKDIKKKLIERRGVECGCCLKKKLCRNKCKCEKTSYCSTCWDDQRVEFNSETRVPILDRCYACNRIHCIECTACDPELAKKNEKLVEEAHSAIMEKLVSGYMTNVHSFEYRDCKTVVGEFEAFREDLAEGHAKNYAEFDVYYEG